jgi:hypothetical protein
MFLASLSGYAALLLSISDGALAARVPFKKAPDATAAGFPFPNSTVVTAVAAIGTGDAAAVLNSTVTSIITNIVNNTIVQVSTVTENVGASTVLSVVTDTLVTVSTVTQPVTQTVGGGETSVIIIEQVSFFTFTSALGGLPPDVLSNSNNNGTFVVAGQPFTSLGQAASAACNIQFQSCSTVIGQGFEITDCQSQLVLCQGAASTATITAPSPETSMSRRCPPLSPSCVLRFRWPLLRLGSRSKDPDG